MEQHEVARQPLVRTGRWTPARVYLLVFALVHLPPAIAGLLINQSFPLGPEAARAAASDYVFGVFKTNGWHTLGALALGVIAAWATFHPERARSVALGIGGLHVGLVVSLILKDPSFFLIASNDADQIVHASSAVGGLVCGLLTQPDE